MYIKDGAERDVSIEVENMRKAAALFPQVRKIISSFDGKVYNIRLSKAFSEQIPGSSIFVEKTGAYLGIYYYDRGRHYTIAQISLKDMAGGKRIPAEKLIESAKKFREINLKTAAEYEESMNHIGEIKKQLEGIEKLFEKVSSSVPSYVLSACGLNYRLRNY